VVIDMEREWTIDAKKFHSMHKHSPFDGQKVKGKPVLTIVRGKIVAKEGKAIGVPGFGKLVTRMA
jgi:allantoinase